SVTPLQNFVPMCVISVLAAPVAQTCSLLYRRFLTCHSPPASNAPPIANRRYGRLKICATVSRYVPIGIKFCSRSLGSRRGLLFERRSLNLERGTLNLERAPYRAMGTVL